MGSIKVGVPQISSTFNVLTYSTALTYGYQSLSPNCMVTLTGNTTVTIGNTNSSDSGELVIIKTAGTEVVTFTGTLIGTLKTTAGGMDVIVWQNISGTIYFFVQGSSSGNAAGGASDLLKIQGLGSPLLAETFSSENITSGVNLGDGTTAVCAIYVPVACTVTGIAYILTTSGNFTADNENRIGLWSIDKVTQNMFILASCVNDASGTFLKGSTNQLLQKAFTTPAALTAGVYYIGMIYNSSVQSTAPALAANGTMGSLQLNAIGGGSFRYGTFNSTTVLPDGNGYQLSASGISGNSNKVWMALY